MTKSTVKKIHHPLGIKMTIITRTSIITLIITNSADIGGETLIREALRTKFRAFWQFS